MDPITIIFTIGGIIIGLIGGIFLPQKFRKEDTLPKISIGPFQEYQNYFEITNHGGDILNMKISISFLQEGDEKKRRMEQFFNASEDSVLGTSHKCDSLKKGETKKVVNCPLFSDDGKVLVRVEGKSLSNKQYVGNFILENKIKNT